LLDAINLIIIVVNKTYGANEKFKFYLLSSRESRVSREPSSIIGRIARTVPAVKN